MKLFKSWINIALPLFMMASVAQAHDMKMSGSREGMFGLKPEYLHTLLNPIPVYGLAIGIAILAAGLAGRNQSTRTIGLVVVLLCSVSAWPVLYFGQHGYNNLAPILDTDSLHLLDEHMNRAERFIGFFYLTAIVALGSIAIPAKFPRPRMLFAILTFLIGAGALGIGAWVSRAGGEVSHSEFRPEETSTSAISNH